MPQQTQQFDVILSQHDYQNYLSQKEKFKNYEKLLNQITLTNEHLQKELKLLKKSFYIQNAQLKYIVGQIQEFIAGCIDHKIQKLQETDDDDRFQNLVQATSNGLNSIETYQINQQLQHKYKETLFQLNKITQLMNCSRQYSISSVLYKKSSTQEEPQVLKPIQKQLQEVQKALKSTIQQKLLLQKEIQIQKTYKKQLQRKIEEYEYKMFNNPNNKEEKSYFIKLMIDEYNRDLQQKLLKLKIPRQQMQSIINSEMEGIKDYIVKLNPQKKKK